MNDELKVELNLIDGLNIPDFNAIFESILQTIGYWLWYPFDVFLIQPIQRYLQKVSDFFLAQPEFYWYNKMADPQTQKTN